MIALMDSQTSKSINDLSNTEALDAFLDESIEQNRKSSFAYRLTDFEGKPVAGEAVKVRLKRHDFDFSFCPNGHISIANQLACGSGPEVNRYWELAAGLFNASTLWWGWRVLEPEPGRKTFDSAVDATAIHHRRDPVSDEYHSAELPRTFGPMQKMVDHALSREMKLIGHALLYPRADVSPNWLNTVSEEQCRIALEAHIRSTVRRYKDDVSVWHPVNENNEALQIVGNLKIDEGLVYRWVREEAPKAELVNNGGFEIQPDFYEQSNARARLAGAPVDSLGIRGYHELYYEDDVEGFKRRWNHFDSLADRYGTQLRYTELGANSEVAAHGIHNPKLFVSGSAMHEGIVSVAPRDGQLPALTESKQAEFLTRMYRMMYAHPKMKECSYWDMVDTYTWNMGKGGLVRADFSRKPAYDALQELIRSTWNSQESLVSDANGEVRWQGHYGTYEIKFRDQSREISYPRPV